VSIRIPAAAVAVAPAVPTGPVDEQPEGYYATDAQVAALKVALAAAGVGVGAYDEVIIQWLARWDWCAVATIASWVQRAAAGLEPSPTVATPRPDTDTASESDPADLTPDQNPVTVAHLSRIESQATDADRFVEVDR
jgi:hypothetical protein